MPVDESWGGRSVLCWPKHHPLGSLSSPIPVPMLTSLACSKLVGIGISKQHELKHLGKQSLFALVSSCWVSSCVVFLSCAGRKGSGCSGSRFLLWGGDLTALQPYWGAPGVSNPRRVLVAIRADALLLGGGRIPYKQHSRCRFDPVVLLVGKPFEYFASIAS